MFLLLSPACKNLPPWDIFADVHFTWRGVMLLVRLRIRTAERWPRNGIIALKCRVIYQWKFSLIRLRSLWEKLMITLPIIIKKNHFKKPSSESKGVKEDTTTFGIDVVYCKYVVNNVFAMVLSWGQKWPQNHSCINMKFLESRGC